MESAGGLVVSEVETIVVAGVAPVPALGRRATIPRPVVPFRTIVAAEEAAQGAAEAAALRGSVAITAPVIALEDVEEFVQQGAPPVRPRWTKKRPGRIRLGSARSHRATRRLQCRPEGVLTTLPRPGKGAGYSPCVSASVRDGGLSAR